MASYAHTTIVGNLGRDPESKFLASGDAVCNFSVAVTESWKDKASGDKKEQTTWYRCNAFGKLAEICGQYLKKGSQVLVSGKMQSRKWSDKDGQERESWELKADQMTMLGAAPAGGQRQQSEDSQHAPNRSAQGAPPNKGKFDDLGDDIPFTYHARGIAGHCM